VHDDGIQATMNHRYLTTCCLALMLSAAGRIHSADGRIVLSSEGTNALMQVRGDYWISSPRLNVEDCFTAIYPGSVSCIGGFVPDRWSKMPGSRKSPSG
jgi:hypothetical protein